MQKVLDHFEALSKIPHCSFEAQQMRDFLVDFAKNCGANVCVGGSFSGFSDHQT